MFGWPKLTTTGLRFLCCDEAGGVNQPASSAALRSAHTQARLVSLMFADLLRAKAADGGGREESLTPGYARDGGSISEPGSGLRRPRRGSGVEEAFCRKVSGSGGGNGENPLG